MRKKIIVACIFAVSLMTFTGCNAQDMEATVNEVSSQVQSVLTEENIAAANEAIASLQNMSEADIEAFAKSVQDVVAEADLSALAELCNYPVYIGNIDATVESADDLMALYSSDVFTPELQNVISNIDLTKLEITEAGIVMGGEKGNSNVIVGYANGKLGITGINDIK